MRPPARPLLFGAVTTLGLAALGMFAWLALLPHPALTAQETLPTPPEPPRLGSGEVAERCFALVSTDPEGARIFAETWEAQGGGEGARHCLALSLLGLGDPAQAATRLERLAAGSQAGHAARAAVFAQAAQAWLMIGDANRAFGAATMALTLMPDDPDLLTDRAVALGSLGRYREAIEDLDAALRLDPDRAEALVFRAAANRSLDRFGEARRDVDRALRLLPANPEALLERGILRQLAGDADGARQDWERVIALAPTSAAADLAAQNLALNEAGPARR
jgi:tetratricopeptide (TPR) repeat protein